MRIFLVLSMVLGFASSALTQNKKIEAADELYYYHKYHEAITAYMEILEDEKSIDRAHVTAQIAKTYWHLHDYENSEIWYEKLVRLGSGYDAESHYEYGQLLRDMAKYKLAREQFEDYVKMSGKFHLEDPLMAMCDWPQENTSVGRTIIAMTNIETGGVCMGFTNMKDALLVSHPQSQDFSEHTVYYDLATAKNIDSVNFKSPILLPGETNHSFYEGAPSFTADGKKMYYTSNASENEKYKEKKAAKKGISHDGVNVLEIYEATLENGRWVNIHKLEINDPEHNNAFPHISDDGSRLYFASDRPGGEGLMDLYVCLKTGDSTWSEPKNLGPHINTFENDIYPYIHNDNFYFSSRGLPGYGGLDVFKAPYKVGEIGDPVNMGMPINTEKDEFCLVFKDSGDCKGYLASNRDGTHGYDHIYYFNILDEVNPYDTLSGTVLSQLTEEPLSDVIIKLYEKEDDGSFTLKDSLVTDNTGNWDVVALKDREYKLEFELKGYNPHEEMIPVNDNKVPSNREKILTKLNPFEMEMSLDPGSVLTLRNIYFDFDKANIRSDSRKILNNLIKVLNEHPEVRIELGAHTDAVGPNDYNMRLSDKRAKSCRKYLTDNGIAANRIEAKGYGETQIVNGCWKWNDCTEEENEVNRRVEITILDKIVSSAN